MYSQKMEINKMMILIAEKKLLIKHNIDLQ